MLEALGSVLGNSHFEAYLGGPMVGVIFACIFSALGNRPPSGSDQGQQSPQEARDRIDDRGSRRSTLRVKEVHHHHYHRAGTNSNDDAPAIFIVAGLALLVALFLFAAYLPQIAGTLYFVITAVAMFSLTASLLACLTGQFNTPEWWMLSIFPSVASVGCFWLTVIAYQSISPDVVAYAQSLLGNSPMSFSVVINSALKFFQSIKSDYVHWMLFEMLAFMCIAVCALIAFLQCVHYVSLSNTRVEGSSMWRALTLWTKRFSGMGTIIFVAVFLAAGWLLATGGMYQLFH
jgi:hypothetical protein